MNKRQLILEDGKVFTGVAFGGEANKIGEVIFNTGMTGYQEVLSDPNYFGNIAVMTYPTIGNYGINRDDFESSIPFISGMIVKEVANYPSNFRSEETLDDYLKQYNIPGIAGIDTRALTRYIRENGMMKGIIVDETVSVEEAKQMLENHEDEQIPVHTTSVSKPYIVPGDGPRVVVIDLGMKHTILHELMKRGMHVTVVPYDYSVESILRFKPDGILISNGPGNPEDIKGTIEAVKQLTEIVPIFGIGLGHQVFALANGASTEKMKVGNYGVNYPVKHIETDKSWITTQSRQYTVSKASLVSTALQVTYTSINDGTIEGLKHTKNASFSVQFNPEGAPGSNETNYLFDEFLQVMEQNMDNNGDEQNA